MFKITLIPGDGIGPEIINSTVKVIEASGVSIQWDVQQAGESAISKYKTPLPKQTLSSIRKNKVALKGPTSTPIGKGFRSVNVALRKSLDLYANVRPARIMPGVKTNFKNVDLVTIRENLEDLYIGIEYEKGKFKHKDISKDAAVSLKVISEKNSANIINFAFNYAKQHKRKSVTAVHKANILKFTDGLFLETFYKLSKKFPSIKSQDRIVDNMAMQLTQKPELYDILVCPNLYGDIISDLCSGLVGGLGVAPSANLGTKYAVFEPVHGSAPKYAGKNKVNPTSTILAGALMLKHIGENKAAIRIEKAVKSVILKGKHVTYDINPKKPSSTSEMSEAIIKEFN